MKKVMRFFLRTILLYFIVANIIIYYYGKSEASPSADTMIILGAQVIDTPARPNRSLKERLDVAIIYLNNNPNTKVIVCGGQGSDESATESSVMRKYLIAHGISHDRIYEENKSTRTAHQFIYAKELFDTGKTVIVTSDFHLLRSLMLAKRSGLSDITGLPAPVKKDNRDKIVALWREPLALTNSFIFDHPK